MADAGVQVDEHLISIGGSTQPPADSWRRADRPTALLHRQQPTTVSGAMLLQTLGLRAFNRRLRRPGVTTLVDPPLTGRLTSWARAARRVLARLLRRRRPRPARHDSDRVVVRESITCRGRAAVLSVVDSATGRRGRERCCASRSPSSSSAQGWKSAPGSRPLARGARPAERLRTLLLLCSHLDVVASDPQPASREAFAPAAARPRGAWT